MKYNDLKRWYVVANRTHAAFYEESGRKLTAVTHFFDSKARLSEKELDADRPGSSASSGGIHHTFDGNFNSHQVLATRFAKKIAEQLEAERQKGSFGMLVLVAEPKFLGMLKKSFSASLKSMVDEEVPRDFVYESEQDLKVLIQNAIETKYRRKERSFESRPEL